MFVVVWFNSFELVYIIAPGFEVVNRFFQIF
nr:MAG TPA: hypothetical protein [Caudoviricetes sp.]